MAEYDKEYTRETDCVGTRRSSFNEITHVSCDSPTKPFVWKNHPILQSIYQPRSNSREKSLRTRLRIYDVRLRHASSSGSPAVNKEAIRKEENL